MTILVHRVGFWAIVGVAVGTTLGIGIGAHAVMAEAGEMLLFASIVAATVLLLVGGVVFARSISVSRTLQKLNEMSRSTGASPEPGLRRLGELGVLIARLYSQQMELGARKSDKIRALSSLSDHLLTIAVHPIAVCDPAGTVQYLSPPLLQELELPRAEAVGTTVDSLMPDTNLPEAAHRFERDRTPITLEPGGRRMTVLPIYSRSGKLTYCVCVLGDVEVAARTASPAQRSNT